MPASVNVLGDLRKLGLSVIQFTLNSSQRYVRLRYRTILKLLSRLDAVLAARSGDAIAQVKPLVEGFGQVPPARARAPKTQLRRRFRNSTIFPWKLGGCREVTRRASMLHGHEWREMHSHTLIGIGSRPRPGLILLDYCPRLYA